MSLQLSINNRHVSINHRKVINNHHLLREIRTNNIIVTTKGQGRGQNNINNFGNRPQIDKISVPYTELVPYLIHVGAIVPKEIPVTTPPFRPKHDPNASCAYHVGFIGHSTEDCWALKYKIQDLINQEILTFSEEKPNVKTNPLPNHGGATVNAVVEEETTESVLRAEDVKTPLSVVSKRLEQFGFLVGIHNDCTICKYDPDNSDELRGAYM